jgi:hypothetical protein
MNRNEQNTYKTLYLDGEEFYILHALSAYTIFIFAHDTFSQKAQYIMHIS